MSESIDWSALDPALDEMLAERIPTRKCADLLGVGTEALRLRMRVRGINLPRGRIPGTKVGAELREQMRRRQRLEWARRNETAEARCQWAAVHHSNIVRGIIAQLQAAQREMRA